MVDVVSGAKNLHFRFRVLAYNFCATFIHLHKLFWLWAHIIYQFISLILRRKNIVRNLIPFHIQKHSEITGPSILFLETYAYSIFG